MKFKVKNNAILLYHLWSESYRLPDGYKKIRVEKSFVINEEQLYLDPYKGSGGWTKQARTKSIAGTMLGDVHPLWCEDKEGLDNFAYVEQNYYIFNYPYKEDVDLILIHKRNVEVINGQH